jgi:hypothetical protein
VVSGAHWASAGNPRVFRGHISCVMNLVTVTDIISVTTFYFSHIFFFSFIARLFSIQIVSLFSRNARKDFYF